MTAADIKLFLSLGIRVWTVYIKHEAANEHTGVSFWHRGGRINQSRLLIRSLHSGFSPLTAGRSEQEDWEKKVETKRSSYGGVA